MSQHLERLCRKINYTFHNTSYLKQALTHRSASFLNNERFEFLGDAILSFVIANALFKKFPQECEGQLSRVRAYLVKGEMLAKIGLTLNLGECLYLGQGELKSGGFRRESILADATEALFAAIYLDGGIHQAEKVILHLYQDYLDHPELNQSQKDYKTQLQEYLQAHKHPLPQYTLIEVLGEEHHQVFHVTCEIPQLKQTAKGEGETRRKAEQTAAKLLLERINPDRG